MARPGSCTVCEVLAERLSGAGWPVLTTSDKPGRLIRLTDMLTTVWRRRREYAVAQVDVYSGPSFIWAESVCWLLGRLHKPFILTLHGGNLPAFAARWPRRVRRLLSSATVVTTPSRYLQEALRNYREDVFLLPNAIDIDSYPFRLRQMVRPKLIWLRALHAVYNPCMAVRVVAELIGEFPMVELTMYGPDKGDGSIDQVRSDLKRLNLEDKVILSGSVSKAAVANALNTGDIFLNTTYHESFGVSVMEAAACGLCIVTTNVGELPLLWKDGYDSLLVQPNDANAMARSVRRLLREKGLAEKMSERGRANAEQFAWPKILPRWEELLAQASVAFQKT